jgi:hypothetical protein
MKKHAKADAKPRLGGALPYQHRASEILQTLSVLNAANHLPAACQQCRVALALPLSFNGEYIHDVRQIAEQAIRTLVHHAAHFGDELAVRYLAYRAHLADYKPQGCYQTIEDLVKRHSVKNADIWNATLKRRDGQKAARSPQHVWIAKLLDRAMFWRACLQSTPKAAHQMTWLWWVKKQLGFKEYVPFPETFVHKALQEDFVDEIALPLLRLIKVRDKKQWEYLGYKTRMLKTGPNWKKIRTEALKTVKRIAEQMRKQSVD